MTKIVDTYDKISDLFVNGEIDLDKWKKYIYSVDEGGEKILDLLISDAKSCISTGMVTFEKDYLPVINAVYNNPKLFELHQSFLTIVDDLNLKINTEFTNEIDAYIVLYLGLCNGAGWVTKIDGKTVVLLGVEKIIELGWCSVDDMRGLVYHELGHVYQAQHGTLERKHEDSSKNYIWQLFVEGVAMVFEQSLVGDIEYFHQNKNGWKEWCDGHIEQILCDFDADLPLITDKTQRYFGDWVNYCGYGDVGYYLGARFIQYVLKFHSFDEIINFDIDTVCSLFYEYVNNTIT